MFPTLEEGGRKLLSKEVKQRRKGRVSNYLSGEKHVKQA